MFAPDCPRGPKQDEVVEAAYRRGFQKGRGENELRAWCVRLLDWRIKQHGGQAERPEWLGR
jgi:hypothetical protein